MNAIPTCFLYNTLFNRIAGLCSAGFLSVSLISDAQIVNGDFETGDLTGWTHDNVTINSSTPLAGSYSAVVGSGSGSLVQSLDTPFTTPVTFSALVASADPGGANDRSLNLILDGSGDQINLRVTDSGDDGISDVSVFNGGGWTDLNDLDGAFLFGGAANSLSITMNNFNSGSFNYSVSINSSEQTGITAVQGSSGSGMADFGIVQFVSGGNVKVPYEVDNVSVTAVPEPATAGLLIGCFALGWVVRRRH